MIKHSTTSASPRGSAATPPLTAWMQILGDSTRLRLLHLLAREELGVAELCGIVQLPQSTVSRHLKLLAGGGWVQQRRRGTSNLYQLARETLEGPPAELWELCHREIANQATTQQDDLRLARCLRDRHEETMAFFADSAHQWDSLCDELYGTDFHTSVMTALLPPSWTVADLGCGTGRRAARLAGFVRQVVGVDRSEEMLAAARRHTEGLRNVKLHRASLENLPLDKASCDAALLVLVLAYIDDPRRVLVEAGRILRAGGRLIVTDLLEHDREGFRQEMRHRCRGFTPRRLATLLRAAGFADVRTQIMPAATEARGPALLIATAAAAERHAPQGRFRTGKTTGSKTSS